MRLGYDTMRAWSKSFGRCHRWGSYPPEAIAGAADITHNPHVVGKMAAHIVLPWVHRISPTQGMGLGRLPRAASQAPPILPREFVFRFNPAHPECRIRILLGIAAAHHPLSYKMLISPEAKDKGFRHYV